MRATCLRPDQEQIDRQGQARGPPEHLQEALGHVRADTGEAEHLALQRFGVVLGLFPALGIEQLDDVLSPRKENLS